MGGRRGCGIEGMGVGGDGGRRGWGIGGDGGGRRGWRVR